LAGKFYDCKGSDSTVNSKNFGVINCNQRGNKLVFMPMNSGNNLKYGFIELVAWPLEKVDPLTTDWMPV
jgi:hypothetical protein